MLINEVGKIDSKDIYRAWKDQTKYKERVGKSEARKTAENHDGNVGCQGANQLVAP
jgi:hypothetical protein